MFAYKLPSFLSILLANYPPRSRNLDSELRATLTSQVLLSSIDNYPYHVFQTDDTLKRNNFPAQPVSRDVNAGRLLIKLAVSSYF